MMSVIFSILMSVAFGFMAWRFWKLQQSLQFSTLKDLNLNKVQDEPSYVELQANVRELRHAMGGVVKTLNVMGHQVHHLNNLAGSAMEAAAREMENEGYETDMQRPQIMIEFHGQDNAAQSRMIMPDDLPPEMVERLNMFQTVYTAIINETQLPSQRNPEQN